jgi:aspartyl/asparaginyl beta-hydroxylase (cupin superfamily)
MSFQLARTQPTSRRSRLFVAATALPDTTSPLSPTTFAGMVERGLLERFEEKAIPRVLASWRLLDKDYYHKEYVGEPGKENESDMLQECSSYVPGLPIMPFWNAEDFSWAELLESKYPEIRKEFDNVNANMRKLQEEGNNIWAGALTEDASSYGEGWRTLGLMNRGRWDPVNVNLFPKTATAVHESGIPATEVFFASMAGPSDIKKHSDFTNFVLTSHLAVDIPYSGGNKCRITVGDETREWVNGNVMVFDTSLIHDAVNESDKIRYILMFRVWHPDLAQVEREALQFIYDCLELPGLVSDNPEERYVAAETAKSVRAFPVIESKSKGSGFGERKPKGKKQKGKGKAKKGFGV